jgi:imidazole glycerol-phosphate synthase subunit HisH
MIVVVDYGAGNVQSVVNALEAIGADAELTTDPARISAATGVIVPGVGAARDTMANLEKSGLIEPVMGAIAADTPYLGICMGMQALMTYSEEHGGQACLDVVPGVARQLETDLAVPHMGWNAVRATSTGKGHPLLDGIPDGAEFYFVHSFACFPTDPEWVLAETDYGTPFPSIIGRGNIMSTQFHPEKSGAYGLQMLKNFIRIARAGGVQHLANQHAGATE